MKTLLFIIGTSAAFILSQHSEHAEKNHPSTTVSTAYADSVAEAGRVEMLRNKMQ